MGKRSDFERKDRDFYPTPYEPVVPLLAHLKPGQRFIEPCAGDGRLIRHLQKNGLLCAYACDIEPLDDGAHGIEQKDVLFFDPAFPECDLIITNPPWEREAMHRMIDIFRAHAPTWLLFDADWMHTVQAIPFAPFCRKVVSIGRVKWIEGSEGSGMDNCCWYLFDKDPGPTEFYFRT